MLTHIPEICKRENRMSVCCHFSCVQLFVTLWTVAHQAPLFMGFSRQEYWSGLPFPSPGDLLNPGTILEQALNLGLLHCRHILYYLNHQGRLKKVVLSSSILFDSLRPHGL